MTHDSYTVLVDRIYDTALDPASWGDVLCELSQYLGARGAMIFEVLEGERRQRLISPYVCKNYDGELVRNYMKAFSDYELKDQIAFAKLSAEDEGIRLVNDIEVTPEDVDLSSLPHMVALADYGIRHRTGAVLNQDSWNIDRFSLQYEKAGGADADDKKRASKILPHVSKALRIGRPLIRARMSEEERLQLYLDTLNYGVAVLTSNAEIIFRNIEFMRILDETEAFKLTPENRLAMRQDGLQARYRALIEDENSHGRSGARPRNEVIFANSRSNEFDSHVLVEISPIKAHPILSQLPRGSRLVTAFDSLRAHEVDPEIIQRFYRLSNTECEVLEMMARGYSNAKIADIRGRAVDTINSQTKTLFRKTFTNNRTELVQLSTSLNTPFSSSWF